MPVYKSMNARIKHIHINIASMYYIIMYEYTREEEKEIKDEKESKQQQVVRKNRIMTSKSFALLYHKILTEARAKCALKIPQRR